MQPSLFIGISYNGADVCKKVALIMLWVINNVITASVAIGLGLSGSLLNSSAHVVLPMPPRGCPQICHAPPRAGILRT